MAERCLVTGAAGFIGSNLCKALTEEPGSKIVGIDNFESGRRRNLSALGRNPRFEIIEGDCKDFKTVARALEGCNVVYHLAANPDVRRGAFDASKAFESNVVATRSLLEAIRIHGSVEHLVFASTSTVYGEPKILPTPETYGPLQPISHYGASKLACEALISAYSSLYDFRSTILRLANVLGPRSSHGVVYDFIAKLKKDPTRLEILGDGTQSKSYISVEDCVKGVLIAKKATRTGVEIFNLGSEDRVSVLKIADIIQEEMGLAGKVVRVFASTNGGRGWPGDVKEMLLDVNKLKSRGWKPSQGSAEAVRSATRSLLGN